MWKKKNAFLLSNKFALGDWMDSDGGRYGFLQRHRMWFRKHGGGSKVLKHLF